MKRIKWVILLQSAVIIALLAGMALMWRSGKRSIKLDKPAHDMVRLALLQYSTTGKTKEQIESKVLKKIESAFKQGAEYVILPEYAFISYANQRNAVAEAKGIDETEVIGSVKALARANSGYIIFNHLIKEGESVYNAAIAVDKKGEVRHVHYKTILSSGDGRIGLTPGEKFENVALTHGKVGFVVCRSAKDLFNHMLVQSNDHSQSSVHSKDYLERITNLTFMANTTFDKSQIVVIQLAHAGRTLPVKLGRTGLDYVWDAPELYVEMAQHWAMYSKSYVALVNKGGPEQPNALYAGQSCVIAPNGRIIGTAGYAPGMLLVDLPLQSDGVLDTTTERLYQTVVYDIPFPRKIVK